MRRGSDEELEAIRRSVAMLAPGHPGALDREAALELLAELQHLKRRARHRSQLLAEIRALLDEAEEDE